MTRGGIHGSITGLTDTVVTLEIAKDVRIKVTRDAIGGAATQDAAPAGKKEGKKSES